MTGIEIATPSAPDVAPVTPAVPVIPEKFGGDVGKLASAYAELEGKLAKRTDDPDPAKRLEVPGETPKTDADGKLLDATGDKPTDKAAADAAASALPFAVPGVAEADLKGMSVEFEANGKLSEVSYKMLEMAGYNEAMVNQYIAGAAAKVATETVENAAKEAEITKVKDTVGGADAFNQLTEWAKTGLSPAEIKAYNNMVDGANADQATAAVNWLKGKRAVADGTEPGTALEGAGGPGQSTPGFRSMEEMRAAQRDPRYKNDRAFQSDFETKMKASKF